MSTRPSNALLWFGVLGGALAWAAQFVSNLAFSFARCNSPNGRWQLPVHGWELALGLAAIAIGVGAEAVCVRLFLATRGIGHDAPPPVGRVHFLAVVGLTVNFLSLMIVVMTTIGAPMLQVCQQS